MGVIGETGKHGPLHCTSQGKVLVAFSPPAVGDHLVETLRLDKCGPNSITDRARFRDEIAAVRACGYATADEEHEAGIRTVSVPIFWRHDTVAALATAAPAYRVDLEQLVEHVPMLTRTAEALAAVMPPA